MERTLEGEMIGYLGYEKHAFEGRDHGDSRNAKTSKRAIAQQAWRPGCANLDVA